VGEGKGGGAGRGQGRRGPRWEAGEVHHPVSPEGATIPSLRGLDLNDEPPEAKFIAGHVFP